MKLKKCLQKNIIARGNGRSYGDIAIGAETTICTKNLNKIISLIMTLRISCPVRGFARKYNWEELAHGCSICYSYIAADVHGKNHHKEGNFGKYINWIEIISGMEVSKCFRKFKSFNLVGLMVLSQKYQYT